MMPLDKFCRGLFAAQTEFNEAMDEIRAFAEVLANRKNTLDMDEDGFFYVTAHGPLEELIPTVEKQLEKLKRIKKQKDEAV